MEGKRILAGKGPIIIKILRILVALGWLAFFIYNLYLVRFLGNEYIKDPSNFVFFNDEQQRIEYKMYDESVMGSEWIDRASTLDQCRPMIYFNDFYFDKLDPIWNWIYLLIILTIAIRIPYAEWMQMKSKIEKIAEKLEDDDEKNP